MPPQSTAIPNKYNAIKAQEMNKNIKYNQNNFECIFQDYKLIINQ